jgi:hypothetical protein
MQVTVVQPPDLTLCLPAERNSPRTARVAVGRLIEAPPTAEFLDDAVLLTQEVVAHAVHRGHACELCAWLRSPSSLRVQVCTEPGAAGEWDALRRDLIGALATRWGERTCAPRPQIWFELDVAS